ncbi:MAG: DegQ family serine endoprotease [Pseudomonadales bacterium]|nr:DegQ family serine endoprotease [Pseudomonadales bacterium]
MMTRRMPAFAFILYAALTLVATSVSASSLPEFTKLVKKASPAIVNISATRQANPTRYDQFDEQDVPEFFRRFFRNMPRNHDPRPSAGSGFILSSDGYILTNNHVVEGADEIVVALSDRRELEAKLVGADELSDLALLKIDAKGLPTVDLGDSDKLEVGEWVVAIGSPFGFEHSVTAGIVSAKGRSLPDPNGNYVPFIQTDVAINPGNSGGPLFNMDGKVVGINSQIFTRSGGFMGLSFAIPIDVAMEVVDQLKETGTVSRGWLGVLIQRVDRDLAESFGMERAAGALVTQVFADSPAEAAGIKEGDIIVKYNDKQIDLSSELPHFVGRTKPGTKVEMTVVRAGKKQELDVTIGKLDEDNVQARRGGSASPGSAINRIGVETRDLRPDEKERLGVEHGVLVTQVSGKPAEDADINEGDVITTINNEWIDSRDQFKQVVDGLPKGVAIPVRIVRNGNPAFTVIKIPE